MKITGFIETYLTDKNGVKRKVGSHPNTIDPTFFEILAENLDTGRDLQLSSLFTVVGTPPTHGGDGIYIRVEYSGFPDEDQMTITTLSQPAAHQFRATGVFTNNTGRILDVVGAYLGKYYSHTYETFTDFFIATGSPGFATETVPIGETFTVVWTITFTTH